MMTCFFYVSFRERRCKLPTAAPNRSRIIDNIQNGITSCNNQTISALMAMTTPIHKKFDCPICFTSVSS